MPDYVFVVQTGKYELVGNNAYLDQSDHPLQCRGEWIDIDVAMTLLSETNEELVENLIAEVQATITAYLGRELLDCTHTDSYFRPETHRLSLANWPITKIHSIRFNGKRQYADNFDLNEQLGVLHRSLDLTSMPARYDGTITVNYDSGYATPPRELQAMFRALLVDFYTADAGASGSVGTIKKVSLTGVAAVEFNNPGITYSGIDRQLGVPEPLKQYVGLLDRYKSDRVMGLV